MNDEVDAICIGTWPYMHATISIEALESGKHVLTEARMAMDSDEAEAMFNVSKNYPELIQTKYWLSAFGKVRMSGTGSTLYIEFDSYESAIEADREIGNRYRSKMVSSLESYDIFS